MPDHEPNADGADDPSRDADQTDGALPDDVVEEAERLTRLARRAADPAEAAAYREERAELVGEHDYEALLRTESGGPGSGPGTPSPRSVHTSERAPGDERSNAGAERSDAGENPPDARERPPDASERSPDSSESHPDANERRPEAGSESSAPADEVLVLHPEEWLVDGDVDPTRIDDVDRAVEVHLDGSGDPDDWETVYEENHAVAEAVRAAHGDRHGENAAEFAEYVSNHYAKPLSAVTAAELRRFREEYYPRNVWPTDEQAAVLDRSLELVYAELSVPLPAE